MTPDADTGGYPPGVWEDEAGALHFDIEAMVHNLRAMWCPRCGMPTKKATEAEALAECPERDYAAEDAEALSPNERSAS